MHARTRSTQTHDREKTPKRSVGAETRVCDKAREGANAVDNFRRRLILWRYRFFKPFVIGVRHTGDFGCSKRADSAN